MQHHPKVLFLASWYPNRIHPTQGIFIKRHAQAVQQYCDVAVLYVTSDRKLEQKRYELTYNTDEQVSTCIVYYAKVRNGWPIISSIQKLYRFTTASFKGWQCLKEKWGQPQLAHLNVILPYGFIALLFYFWYRLPYLVTEHWTGYITPQGQTFGNLWTRFYARLVSFFATALTTVSQHLAQNMQRHGLKGHYHYVPNVINTKMFYPPSNKKNSDKKRLLHISTLVDDHKNISGLLRVVQQLHKERQDFQLDIADDGPYTNYFKEKAKGMGLENVVHFHGIQPPDKIAELYRQSHCFVLFSNVENQPCVLLESLASGLPIVSTNVGGIPEVIDKEHGLLLEPADEAELLKYLHYMLDHAHKYNPERLSRYAHQHFSYEAVGRQFYQIYKEILGLQ